MLYFGFHTTVSQMQALIDFKSRHREVFHNVELSPMI